MFRDELELALKARGTHICTYGWCSDAQIALVACRRGHVVAVVLAAFNACLFADPSTEGGAEAREGSVFAHV